MQSVLAKAPLVSGFSATVKTRSVAVCAAPRTSMLDDASKMPDKTPEPPISRLIGPLGRFFLYPKHRQIHANSSVSAGGWVNARLICAIWVSSRSCGGAIAAGTGYKRPE